MNGNQGGAPRFLTEHKSQWIALTSAEVSFCLVCWHSSMETKRYSGRMLHSHSPKVAYQHVTQQSTSLICRGMSARQHETFLRERQFEILCKNEKALDVNRCSHTSL